MAYKTPGVYFSEIDNTDYQNPAATINTTVAIIGFAKKGPIGVPTEITTYNDYKSTFGNPISGQYAGLAVKNVLSAGGTVLFTRVADTTLATKSNVVLKNGSEAVDGLLVINKTSDFTSDTAGYATSTVYSARIQTASNEEKNLIVRTPNAGKLRLSNMLSQFAESLEDTAGYDEFKTSEILSKSSYRNFNIDVTYDSDDDDAVDGKKTDTMGPFFMKVNGSDNGSGAISNTVDALQTLIEDDKIYSNAYQKLYVLGNSADNKIDWTTTEAAKYQMYIGKKRSTMFQFTIKKAGQTETKKRIEITGVSNNGSDEYYISMDDLAAALTENLVNDKIYVKWCYNAGTSIVDSNEDANCPYLLFVSLDTDVKSFDIIPYIKQDEDGNSKIISNSLIVPVWPNQEDTSAFYYYKDEDEEKSIPIDTTNLTEYVSIDTSTDKFNDEVYYYDGETKTSTETEDLIATFSGLFCTRQKCVETTPYGNNDGKNLIDVEYDKNTISIKFIAGDYYPVDGTTITVNKTEFGNFLFNDSDISDEYKANLTDASLYAQNTENSNYNIGYRLATVTGEKAINCKVKMVNGNIAFYEEGNMVPGIMLEDSESQIDGYEDLALLIGKSITESEFINNELTADDLCLIEKEGVSEVDPSKQDTVVFYAREYGEGTTNIGVEILTITSPVDGSKTHNIYETVNGTTKNTWEDVSYDPSADNYFVNLINEEPENGGSENIKVKAIKKNINTPEVSVLDTANYTDSGVVYLGKPFDDDSINRVYAGVKESEYESYDYSVGTNGVPDDTSDLFIEAMDTLNSGLSNKDLYAWHILITPDNITEDVQNQAISLCEYMEDAIYIADPPIGLSRDKVVKWHNGTFVRNSALSSNYACTYWPWLKTYDSTTGKYSWIMPSVVMAAQFCLTDKNYQPWYAPAGEACGNILSAVDLEQYPNKNDRDQMYLNLNRVNPFIKLKDGRILAFGEKTCQRKESTLAKIHTRRMLISLKHKMRNSLKSFLFLPTMSENISKVRAIVSGIMEQAKVGGGVESYRVVCDSSNNTTETLQQDILNVSVVCVPTGCIEQVEIQFTLDKSSETVA